MAKQLILRTHLNRPRLVTPLFDHVQFTSPALTFVCEIRNIFDKTTPRLDENSKIVVVDGAHAVGKTAFAQELAENLEMKYFPHVTMDDIYVNHYGDDLRNYNHLLSSYNQPWGEKEFARDPMSGHDGAVDRMHAKLFYLKFNQYLAALRHLLNTG